jgi:superfamily I DNA and RNA helicase
MGLLRPDGMLTGFTTQEDWENIGYRVKEGNNELDTSYPEYDPNKFWNDGGITISNVYRAKGNEAYMVYVDSGIIIEVLKTGYSYQGKLFREAEVIISE